MPGQIHMIKKYEYSNALTRTYNFIKTVPKRLLVTIWVRNESKDETYIYVVASWRYVVSFIFLEGATPSTLHRKLFLSTRLVLTTPKFSTIKYPFPMLNPLLSACVGNQSFQEFEGSRKWYFFAINSTISWKLRLVEYSRSIKSLTKLPPFSEHTIMGHQITL